MLSNNAKYLSKAERKYEKDNGKITKEEENADEFLKEQFDGVESHTNQLAVTAEDMEKTLGSAANLQEAALDDEMRTKEWWYADMERAQQDIRNANVKQSGENAKELTKTVVKMMETGDLTGESIDRDIQSVGNLGKKLQ